MSKRKKSTQHKRPMVPTASVNEKLHLQLSKAVRARKLEDAIKILNQLTALSPDRFDYYNLLGDLCLKTRHFGGAIEAFSKALQLQSKHPDVYVGLGLALHEFKKFDGAAASFEIAALYDPGHHRAYGYRALSLIELKQHDAALELFARAISIDPSDPLHYLNRANLLTRLNRNEEALCDYERASSLSPEDAALRLGHAAQWHKMRNYEAALEGVERLIQAGRADAVAYNFKGVVLGDLGRFAESRVAYDHSIDLNPDFHDAKFNKSLNCLLMGDLREGWQLYESRFQRSTFHSPRGLSGSCWYGHQSLSGKTIFVHFEQGLGDCIQFSRYVHKLSALAGQVVLEVPPQLEKLFMNLPRNVSLLVLGQPVPAYDYYCPLMSLPFAFETLLDTIPTEMVCFSRPQDFHLAKLESFFSKQQLKVGVVWSGNAAHGNDHNRSIEFEQFRLAIEDLDEVVCLQKEIRDSDLQALGEAGGVHRVASDLKDMADTAALISKLDLVISVDTSVAHLAATLGKPTWILLPATPDFRWLLNRADSPWYPSVRLFRQQVAGDWSAPLMEIRSQLASLRSNCSPEETSFSLASPLQAAGGVSLMNVV